MPWRAAIRTARACGWRRARAALSIKPAAPWLKPSWPLPKATKTLAFGKELEARSQLKNGMDAGLSRLTEERLDALIVKLANKKNH